MTCDQCGQPLFLCQCQESGVSLPAAAGSPRTGNADSLAGDPLMDDMVMVGNLMGILGIQQSVAEDIVVRCHGEWNEAAVGGY